MRIRRDESGQVLVLTALSMTLLLGFMALAIDVGVLFRAKRNVQIAADAAAVAAALNYAYVAGGSMTQAAYDAAAANGITDSSQVAVHNPPTSGYHNGSGYIEVIITQPNPTYFMRIFNHNSANVAARAVAGIVPNRDCIIALDTNNETSFNVQGSAVINTPNCSIHINSPYGAALCTTGGATINALSININGAQNTQGNCNGTQQNAHTGVGVVPDPYANMTWPSCAGLTPITTTVITPTFASTLTAPVVCFNGSTATELTSGVQLGTYTQVKDPSSGVSNNVGGNQVFIFENGVTIDGNNTVGGTMDIQGGNFCQGSLLGGGKCSFSGNNALNIYAPNSGSLNSIALMAPGNGDSTSPPDNLSLACNSSYQGTGPCLQIQFGTGSGNLNGVIYLPSSTLYMQDNGGGTVVAGIVAYKVYDKSSQLNITGNYNTAHSSTTPLSYVSLVE